MKEGCLGVGFNRPDGTVVLSFFFPGHLLEFILHLIRGKYDEQTEFINRH